MVSFSRRESEHTGGPLSPKRLSRSATFEHAMRHNATRGRGTKPESHVLFYRPYLLGRSPEQQPRRSRSYKMGSRLVWSPRPSDRKHSITKLSWPMSAMAHPSRHTQRHGPAIQLPTRREEKRIKEDGGSLGEILWTDWT